jgi:hypothetical protein
MPTIELWLFTVTDPRTGKRRRVTDCLTMEEARTRCEKLNLTSLRMNLAIFLFALLVGSQVAQPAYGKGSGHASGHSAGGTTTTGASGRSARAMGGGGDRSGYFPGPAEKMDPNRKINEQDCTAPIDLAAGNLRCR